jgi:hypothetical protein
MNTKMAITTVVVAVSAGVLFAQATAPTTQPAGSATKPAAVPDVCRDAVDPYTTGTERSRFFRAAGVDNGLTAKEAATNRTADKPFVRVFDHWEIMRRYDANRDAQLDWFEADSYRKAFRKRVLAVFDKDKNGKLTGAERDAANRVLATGKLSALRTSGDPARPPIWVQVPNRPDGSRPALPLPPGDDAGPLDDDEHAAALRQKFMEKYDANGDGSLSEEEARAAGQAMRTEQKDRMTERFDTDEDGKLDDEERKAMREDQAGPWRGAIEEWTLADYDADGDGKLDEKETATKTAFEKKFGEMGKELDLRFNDIDGDGKVSPEERQANEKEYRRRMFGMLLKVGKYMDRDRDGEVTAEERQGFMRGVRDGMFDWVSGFRERFDEDGDGGLNEAERNALLEGAREEIFRRIEKFDMNDDGQINPEEAMKMLEAFGEEIGVLKDPAEDEKPPAPPHRR